MGVLLGLRAEGLVTLEIIARNGNGGSIIRWLRKRRAAKKLLRPKANEKPLNISEREAALEELVLTKSLTQNLHLLTESAGQSVDLVVRRFVIASRPGAILYFEGLTDTIVLEEILRSLEIDSVKVGAKRVDVQYIADRIVISEEVKLSRGVKDILQSLALGDVAVLVEGNDQSIICDARGWPLRSVEEPEAEITLRGPHDGFIENTRVNLSLLRRRLRTPNFWTENFEIGSLSKTAVVIGYIKGLASEELLAEVRSRLQGIDTDHILDSGQIEEFILDQPYTIFPTVLRTERPDRVVGNLLEGRVVILVENTPVALVVPTPFIAFLQAPDDYNEIVPIGSFVRLLRGISGFVALFLPGAYVAIINYHQELLPSELLLRVTATREGVPFPVVFEIFFMEAVFEVLREAGVRLPRAIGAAISIVGALVLGDAAISAGLVSPAAVIVVAFTAIASFTVPIFSIGIAGRLGRFAFIILGGVFGLFGIQLGFLFLAVHMAGLRSFGYPYLSPLAPLIISDLKDVGIRDYWWKMIRRPKLEGGREPVRRSRGQKPQPPQESP